MLFLSVEDRQVYISTGKGAAKEISDNSLSAIIEDMRPLLRAGQYADAVEQAVVDIGLGLAGRKKEHGEGWDIFPLLFMGGVAFFIGKSML